MYILHEKHSSGETVCVALMQHWHIICVSAGGVLGDGCVFVLIWSGVSSIGFG